MQNILLALLLAGLMGMLGQGVRAIVGLKTMVDVAATNNIDSADLFRASRLVVSLIIGFIAGLGAAFVIGFDKITAVSATNTDVLLGLAAAGYAGTDAIEAFMSKYMPSSTRAAPDVTTSVASSAASAVSQSTAASQIQALSTEMSNLHSKVSVLESRPVGAVPGSTYPSWALARDIKIAQSKYWDYIVEAASKYSLPIAVIGAIGSKESQWGLALRPQGPEGTGDFTARDPAKWGVAMPPDGKGWGRGLMQIDWYSHTFAKSGDWQDAEKNIDFGCNLLRSNVKKYLDQGLSNEDALRSGVSAYNGMSGTHSAYANDVMARAEWLSQHGLDHDGVAAVA